MKVYFYKNYMDGIYFSHKEYDIDYLYCKQCGDYNWMIGEACDAKDMIAKLDGYLVVEPTDGGCDLSEVLKDMTEYFDNIPSLEEAKQIALEARKEEDDE